MPDQHDMTEVVYHGYRSAAGSPVVAVETAAGKHLGVLMHVVQHSPSGLNWGYQGSGPCDTARSLLLAALGDDAVCMECRGSTRVVYVANGDKYRSEPFDPARHPWAKQGWRCPCSDGYKDVPYLDFVEVVAGWGEEWRMTRSDIRAWLEHTAASRRED